MLRVVSATTRRMSSDSSNARHARAHCTPRRIASRSPSLPVFCTLLLREPQGNHTVGAMPSGGGDYACPMGTNIGSPRPERNRSAPWFPHVGRNRCAPAPSGTPYAARMKLRPVVLAFAVAGALLAPASGAVADSTTDADPCAKELRAFSKADRAMLRTERAYRKAKTPKGRARLRKQLAASRRSAAKAARAHDRCQSREPIRQPGLRVTPDPRVLEPIVIDYMPIGEPPAGYEYLYSVTISAPPWEMCGALAMYHIPVHRSGFVATFHPFHALSPQGTAAAAWCTGTAVITVRVRPLGSPPSDLGAFLDQAAVPVSAEPR